MLRLFTYAYAWSSWRLGRDNPDSKPQVNFRKKLHSRIERLIQGLKIHEDIILIEVTDQKPNKFERELFIPLSTYLIKTYCSHNLVSFLISIAKECDLDETLRVLTGLNSKMREYINNRVEYRAPFETHPQG